MTTSGTKLRGFIFFLSLFSGGYSNGQPVIESVNGNIFLDGSLTIEGSGFGHKSPARPVLWDRLTNIPEYAGLSQGDIIPVQSAGCTECFWMSHGTNAPHFNLISPRTTSGATYRGVSKAVILGPDLGGPEPDFLYVNWWFRSSHDFPNGSNKFIRLWQDGAGVVGQRIAWDDRKLSANMPDGAPYYGGWGGVPGQFNNMEIFANSREPGEIGLAKITCIVNNRTVFNAVEAAPGLTAPMNMIRMIGLEASDTQFTNGFVFDWTDIYVDTTPARVVICTSESIIQGSHKEIQIPIEWSDNRIVVETNAGTLPAASQLYLFVYSPDGSRNPIGFILPLADAPPPPGPPSIVTLTQ